MPSARPGGPGLRIARVLAREFGGRSETSLDPDLRVFVTDLTRPYGIPLREDLLRQGVGHSYGEMAEGLLGEALAPDEPVDLLVLAFSAPDVRPGRSTAVHLSRFCPGAPLAFAICDQGAAAAFTALRIAADHVRTGGCGRAVVLVLEQAALHYQAAEPEPLPDRHCAVVLVCEKEEEEEGGAGVTVSQVSGIPGESGDGMLRTRVAGLDRRTALVLGPQFGEQFGPTPREAVREAVRARAGQPITGVWAELAARLPGWRGERRPVLVADLDRRLGRISTLLIPSPAEL